MKLLLSRVLQVFADIAIALILKSLAKYRDPGSTNKSSI